VLQFSPRNVCNLKYCLQDLNSSRRWLWGFLSSRRCAVRWESTNVSGGTYHIHLQVLRMRQAINQQVWTSKWERHVPPKHRLTSSWNMALYPIKQKSHLYFSWPVILKSAMKLGEFIHLLEADIHMKHIFVITPPFFVIPCYLQSVQVHSANCLKSKQAIFVTFDVYI
jgi:hypothetical protein